MRGLVRALKDLLRGLFGFPARGAVTSDVAAAIEERYRRPNRCC